MRKEYTYIAIVVKRADADVVAPALAHGRARSGHGRARQEEAGRGFRVRLARLGPEREDRGRCGPGPLAAYRPRYAKVAALAGLAAEFDATGELAIVERVDGNGMTDFYGVSGRAAAPEHEQMTEAECERKIALLQASWTYFDDVASRVSAELRKGPRGGGRERNEIVRHANGAEIYEFATKVGVRTPLEARGDPVALRAHREAFVAGHSWSSTA